MSKTLETLEEDRTKQLRAVISFLLIASIIALTVLLVIVMKLNQKKAKEEDKDKIVPSVQVREIQKGKHPVHISTQGVVESKRETMLASEIGGRVTKISDNLERGGKVRDGEVLVVIDRSDYEAALASAQVTLADTRLALELERAKVEQAKLDWEKLGSGKPINPLVLREPYLKAAEAKVEAAEKDVNRAEKNLERTQVVAPFDASVRMANVEEGAVVGTGTVVAELYTSEELEVRLPISLFDFGFVNRDAKGNVNGNVILRGTIGAEEYEWKAEPVRVESEIDRKALSASVMVKVIKADRDQFPLPPVGLFVKAEMEGSALDDVAEIPRKALLENNHILLADKDDKVTIREVKVQRLGESNALVSGEFKEGERLILTRIASAVEGMKVEIKAGTDQEEAK